MKAGPEFQSGFFVPENEKGLRVEAWIFSVQIKGRCFS